MSTRDAGFPHFLEVLKIIEGGVAGDSAKATAYARQLAEKLAGDGLSRAAASIQRLLDRHRSLELTAVRMEPRPRRLPVDGESRLALADEDIVEPKSADVVLPSGVRASVEEFLGFVKEADRLHAHGVGIAPSLLVYGPPGCGKTQLARHIAFRLDLPLITGRADALISSFLGSTAKNLRALFDHAVSRPCILFLDEFDAVAKLRDDKQELGELKRVVVSLLQNIDSLHNRSVFLAATNHEHLLDPAVWRRFAFKIHLGLPTVDARTAMFERFLDGFVDSKSISPFAEAAEGLTGGDVQQVSEDAKRRALLDGREQVAPADLLLRIATIRLRDHGQDKTLSARLKETKALAPRVYTNRRLADMFDISVGHVSNLLRRDVTTDA